MARYQGQMVQLLEELREAQRISEEEHQKSIRYFYTLQQNADREQFEKEVRQYSETANSNPDLFEQSVLRKWEAHPEVQIAIASDPDSRWVDSTWTERHTVSLQDVINRNYKTNDAYVNYAGEHVIITPEMSNGLDLFRQQVGDDKEAYRVFLDTQITDEEMSAFGNNLLMIDAKNKQKLLNDFKQTAQLYDVETSHEARRALADNLQKYIDNTPGQYQELYLQLEEKMKDQVLSYRLQLAGIEPTPVSKSQSNARYHQDLDELRTAAEERLGPCPLFVNQYERITKYMSDEDRQAVLKEAKEVLQDPDIDNQEDAYSKLREKYPFKNEPSETQQKEFEEHLKQMEQDGIGVGGVVEQSCVDDFKNAFEGTKYLEPAKAEQMRKTLLKDMSELNASRKKFFDECSKESGEIVSHANSLDAETEKRGDDERRALEKATRAHKSEAMQGLARAGVRGFGNFTSWVQNPEQIGTLISGGLEVGVNILTIILKLKHQLADDAAQRLQTALGGQATALLKAEPTAVLPTSPEETKEAFENLKAALQNAEERCVKNGITVKFGMGDKIVCFEPLASGNANARKALITYKGMKMENIDAVLVAVARDYKLWNRDNKEIGFADIVKHDVQAGDIYLNQHKEKIEITPQVEEELSKLSSPYAQKQYLERIIDPEQTNRLQRVLIKVNESGDNPIMQAFKSTEQFQNPNIAHEAREQIITVCTRMDEKVCSGNVTEQDIADHVAECRQIVADAAEKDKDYVFRDAKEISLTDISEGKIALGDLYINKDHETVTINEARFQDLDTLRSQGKTPEEIRSYLEASISDEKAAAFVVATASLTTAERDAFITEYSAIYQLPSEDARSRAEQNMMDRIQAEPSEPAKTPEQIQEEYKATASEQEAEAQTLALEQEAESQAFASEQEAEAQTLALEQEAESQALASEQEFVSEPVSEPVPEAEPEMAMEVPEQEQENDPELHFFENMPEQEEMPMREDIEEPELYLREDIEEPDYQEPHFDSQVTERQVTVPEHDPVLLSPVSTEETLRTAILSQEQGDVVPATIPETLPDKDVLGYVQSHEVRGNPAQTLANLEQQAVEMYDQRVSKEFPNRVKDLLSKTQQAVQNKAQELTKKTKEKTEEFSR